MISAPSTILDAMGEDSRRVLSLWRALIYMRRASDAEDRRWTIIPTSTEDIVPLIRRMQNTGTLESLPMAPGLYIATHPFARRLPIREREVLFELNPYAVLSHYSALEYHGLTLNQPKVITAWSGARGSMTPLGTSEQEWLQLEPPIAYRPSLVRAQRVRWFRRQFNPTLGVTQNFDGPIPIRITDRERTLIDALQAPDYSGGIGNVLRAWTIGVDFIDPDTIVNYTEQYGIQVLRQRVGYVAEAVGIHHPRFDDWASESVRGGSSKLVGSDPFSPEFDERWNLSLNAPVGELVEI